MLTLTRKSEYAVIAMADLAHRGPERVSARQIAESTQLPLPILTNVLHQLLRHGLVTSTMGSKGGYRLAKTPEEVTFGDMIDAIEGPFKLTAWAILSWLTKAGWAILTTTWPDTKRLSHDRKNRQKSKAYFSGSVFCLFLLADFQNQFRYQLRSVRRLGYSATLPGFHLS